MIFAPQLTPAWSQLRPHEKQSCAWRSRAQFVSMACGRGSGKTELARRRIIRYLPVRKPWPDPKYFYALPTFNQAKRVAWRPLLDLIPKAWIEQLHESELRVKTIFGSELYVVGLDKPQRIEGAQYDGCVLDESCDIKPGTFSRSIVPALSHRDGWCWRIGVPKRAGCGAMEFKQFFQHGLTANNPKQESYQWPSSDILSADKLEWARANLDERDYAEQFEASWLTIGGAIYWAFDEVLNVRSSIDYNPNLPLIVGSDFNVDPMAWVICQYEDETENTIHVLDEIWKRNTNTRETLALLYERYSTHRAGWQFFGDATGQNRHTSASGSDYILILQAKEFNEHIIAEIHYPGVNPTRANRYASVNAMLCNAAGDRRLLIHPRCKNLIRDLTSVAYKENTSEIDTSNPDLTHISDALGYFVNHAHPLQMVYDEMAGVSLYQGDA